MIAYHANSKLITTALIIITAISSTNTYFILNGMDHIFMTFFIVGSTLLLLKWEDKTKWYLLFALSNYLAFVFRPDALIIIAFLFLAALVRSSKKHPIS